MKVLVIGAAGRTGKAVVEQAVAAGHQVTAFVHTADGYKAPDVRVIEGDAADSAVIDAIGGKTPPYKATTLETSVAGTVITSMQRNGVRRLVVISMMGVGESKASVPIYERLLVSTFLRGEDKDKSAMEAAVVGSGLDWVILRPPFLTNGSAKGKVRVFSAEAGEKAHTITRADLASFMLAQLSSDEHLHQAVTIANS